MLLGQIVEEEVKGEEEEEDAFNEDLEQVFSNSQMIIEGMQFLSNSTLLVLLRGNKVRILNTEVFRPEEFYADMHRRVKLYKEGIKEDIEIKRAELGEEISID